ncbi:MAG: acyl-CoA reductase [candidate division NC10 bacterium]|nr:acyl-CoA reductase [candidate division NC10 bacterium]
MIIPGAFLPPSVNADEVARLDFGEIVVETAILTPGQLEKAIEAITEARDRYLAHRPIHTILSSLDQVIALWLDPTSPLRRVAEEALPAATHLSSEMITHGLPAILEGYRKDHLLQVLEEELGDPLFLDTFRPRKFGRSRAYGPRLTTHILSGNIPALAAPSVIFALLVKSAVLVKSSSDEPIFPPLFARSIAEVDPELGRCLAVAWWKGGEETLEAIAFSRSDVVIAYGSGQAITSIKGRVQGRFIGYGHRLSFGVIGREALSDLEEIARRAAYDTSMFDQQGCLSPHLFYVEEGGAATPKGFARALAHAMDELHKALPRGRLSPEEASVIHQLRGAYEFREIAGEDVAVYAGEGMSWTVIYEKDPTFLPSCLNRTVRVKPVGDLGQVVQLVAPYAPYLSAVGIAAPPNRLLPLVDALGRLGVNRICPVGKMQHPPAGWHHDGRFQILDLIRWVDLEEDRGSA